MLTQEGLEKQLTEVKLSKETYHSDIGSVFYQSFNISEILQSKFAQQPKLISWDHGSSLTRDQSYFSFSYLQGDNTSRLLLSIFENIEEVTESEWLQIKREQSVELQSKSIFSYLKSTISTVQRPFHYLMGILPTASIISKLSSFMFNNSRFPYLFLDSQSCDVNQDYKPASHIDLWIFGLSLSYFIFHFSKLKIQQPRGLQDSVKNFFSEIDEDIRQNKLELAQIKIQSKALQFLMTKGVCFLLSDSEELYWKYYYLKGRIQSLLHDVNAAEKSFEVALKASHAVSRRHLTIKELIKIYSDLKLSFEDVPGKKEFYEQKIKNLLSAFQKYQYYVSPETLQGNLMQCLAYLKNKKFDEALNLYQKQIWDISYEYLYPKTAIFYYKMNIILLFCGQLYVLSLENPLDPQTRFKRINILNKRIKEIEERIKGDGIYLSVRNDVYDSKQSEYKQIIFSCFSANPKQDALNHCDDKVSPEKKCLRERK